MHFKGFDDYFEIFRTGKQTDSRGNTRTWTEEDLDKIVNTYDPATNEAPVVVGHPKDNAPAFAWVESLKREGDTLYAKVKDVVTEFSDAVKKGMYKKRSISLYPDGSLRHIGFLGAVPPAVKGLKDLAFNDSADVLTYEFSENYRMNTVGSVFQRLRDWMIEKFGLETADTVINQWDLDDLKRPREEPQAAGSISPLFNELNNEEEMDAKLQKENDELKAQITNFNDQQAAKDQEIAALKAQIAAGEAKARKDEFSSFCEGLIKEGKLLPANKETVMQQLEAAHRSGSEISFSENGQDKKVSAVENLKSILRGMPVQMEFGEIATKASASGQSQNLDPVIQEGRNIAAKINKND